VAGLCGPGVPTILWWSGMREDSRQIFEALLPLADTLLFDSSGGSRDEEAMRKLVAFHAAHPRSSCATWPGCGCVRGRT